MSGLRIEQTSLFFELPAELRLQIYEYALTGHNIHLVRRGCYQTLGRTEAGGYFRPHGLIEEEDTASPSEEDSELRFWHYFRHTICQCPDSDDGAYQRSKEQEVEHDGLLLNPNCSYRDRHGRCLDRITNGRCERLPWELLKVCRLIHYEAALVPYAGNTFSISSASSAIGGKEANMWLSEALNPKQRRAIKSICMTQDDKLQIDSNKFAFHGLKQGVANTLTGLRHLRWTIAAMEFPDCRKKMPYLPAFPAASELTVQVIVGHNQYDKWELNYDRQKAEILEKALRERRKAGTASSSKVKREHKPGSSELL